MPMPFYGKRFIRRLLTPCCKIKVLFPPNKCQNQRKWKNKGKQKTSYVNVNGRTEIERTIYCGEGSRIAPADEFLGIHQSSYSPGVREMCCREALSASFISSCNNLERLAQIKISSSVIRHIAQTEGQKIGLQQSKGEVKADFTSSDCVDNTLITGADGVMIPLVTEEQKRKRRKTEKVKRTKEGRKSTAAKGRPKKGSDGAYKESKVVIFYSKDKKHQYSVSTCGNHKKLGLIMRREGFRIGIDKAASKYSIADGASWIQKQYNVQLPMLEVNILDYFHLKEHVKEVGNTLHGESTPESINWREEIMTTVWEQGSLVMLDRLQAELKRLRSPVKRKSVESLIKYVGSRVDMTDYPTFRAKGYDCGSGPTESSCGCLTKRLKGSGMRWNRDNAQAMMNLESIHFSGQWDRYWEKERSA